MPRRFGIGAVLALTAAFALLLGLLKALGADASAQALFGILFLCVAAGQALLFGGRRPRLASAVVGAILLPVIVVVIELAEGRFPRPDVLCSTPSGAILGYLVGLSVSFVFLVHSWFSNMTDERYPKLALRLLTDEHIPIVARWGRVQPLRHCWTLAGAIAVDEGSLSDRLAAMQQPDATVQMLALVDAETGELLGYAEIAEIDFISRRGQLRLPIVSPSALDRGWLSSMLLHAVVRHAFGQLGLHRVGVHVLMVDNWTLYRSAGFANEGELRDWLRGEKGYYFVRSMSMLQGELPRGSPEARAITLPSLPAETAEQTTPAA
jgi:RimJ/RimL family protein N-acetyltransferase